MTRAEARRHVDLAHAVAARTPDPVAYMRRVQADAEARYARSGSRSDLVLVRAYAESLDGEGR